jgi:hypothetical protein
MGGGNFGGDDGAMKSKVKTMYGRINSEFHPDPEWVVPWEKDEKSEKAVENDYVLIANALYGYGEDGSFLVLTQEATVQKEIADSESDAALNRQDLGEVAVSDDGTHEAMTGTHSHAHTDGQGGSHNHSHSHDNNANHGHAHAEKHHHPHTQKANVEGDGNGNHEPFTGTHTHAHKAYGSQGGDETHTHEHSHDGDSNHGHSHAEKQAEPPVQKAIEQDGDGGHEHAHSEAKSLSLPTPEQAALLGVYNSIGKQLGFPDHTLTTKCDLVPSQSDATVVRTMLSALDDVSDAMITMAQRNDYYVDSLMQMMGVPDVNDTDSANSDTGESTAVMSLLSSLHPGTVKDGREISGKNRSRLQIIHDAVVEMHPDACKGVTGDGTSHQDGSMTVADAQEEARQMGQGDSYDNLSSLMAETVKSVLLKSFEGLDAKPLVEASIQKAVNAAMTGARANLDLLQREQMILMQQVGKLANMPLGRPTNLQRSVTPASSYALDNTASYEEMLGVAGIEAPKQQTLQEALAQTSIVDVPIVRNGSEIHTMYRRWPAGVGGAVGEGVRPPLTSSQKTLMHYLDWSTYNSGGTVDVPLIDDPAERM